MKNFLKGAVIGASVLGLVGAASAAEISINIYGASAQHLFWNDAADNFLTAQGCTNVVQDQFDSKNGITKGTCGTDTVYIRYSSKASFDGILAQKGDSSLAGSAEKCNEGDPGVPAGKAGYYRKMVDESTCPWDGIGGTNCSALKCVDVILGASDVAGESFTQKSKGCLKGPLTSGAPICTGSNYVDRDFSGIDTTGLTPYQPVVVPFGFFANNSVTKTKCLGPDPTEPTPAAKKAVSTWGYQCYDPENTGHSADCIGYYECVSGTCSGGVNSGNACTKATDCPDVTLGQTQCVRIPLDNISRLMATQIFNGQAWYWTDFGAWYNSDPIVACLRHAGSGTHATLDYAVMKGNGWGWDIIQAQSTADPIAWFNDGSSDEMKCINTQTGAIGYADADQLVGSENYPNVHALKYQGIEPRRTKVRNGEYDFFSNQWLYEDPSDPNNATYHQWVLNLVGYASDPANIPATKAGYWATKGEMVFNKGTDQEYPGYVGADNPQLP